MFCPKCGTSNDDSARFCAKCGAALAAAEAPAAVPAPALARHRLDAHVVRRPGAGRS